MPFVPEKCPPTPAGWEEGRWKKHHENCQRAERMTGIAPITVEGWEKVAVILMDRIDAATKAEPA